jgi:hypothetical protein
MMSPSIRVQWPLWIITAALFISIATPAHSHTANKGITAMTFRIHPDQVEARWAISFPDTDKLLTFDKNEDRTIDRNELDLILEELKAVARKDLRIAFGGDRMMPSQVSADYQNDNVEVTMQFRTASVPSVQYASDVLNRLSESHHEFVSIMSSDSYVAGAFTLTTGAAAGSVSISGGSVEGGASQEATLLTFLIKGTEHILFDVEETMTASGMQKRFNITDHVLFLLALLVMCRSFMDVLKIVTTFTVAHSITLGLAATNLVNLPGRIVEPAIALTIIYVGLENIFRWKTIERRWLITFTFGLIHGFGFATAFREMFGEGRSVLAWLLTFNLGVEIGQILVAALIFPLVLKLREFPQFAPRWIPLSSAAVVLMGSWWLLERVGGGL